MKRVPTQLDDFPRQWEGDPVPPSVASPSDQTIMGNSQLGPNIFDFNTNTFLGMQKYLVRLAIADLKRRGPIPDSHRDIAILFGRVAQDNRLLPCPS